MAVSAGMSTDALATGLQDVDLGYASVEKAMEDAAVEQSARLLRKVEYLTVIAAVSAIGAEELFLSVVSVGEIVKGIGLLAAGKRRNELTAWLATLEVHFSEHIFPIDVETVVPKGPIRHGSAASTAWATASIVEGACPSRRLLTKRNAGRRRVTAVVASS